APRCRPWSPRLLRGIGVVGLLVVGIGATAQVVNSRTPAPSPRVTVPDMAATPPGIEAALPALDRAYRLAAADGRWSELIDLAGVIHRLGEVAHDRQGFDPLALKIYRSALTQARREASLDNVMRVAEGLGELGDQEGFRESIRIAEALAAGDREAEADVR